jgi:hypothetical protein
MFITKSSLPFPSSYDSILSEQALTNPPGLPRFKTARAAPQISSDLSLSPALYIRSFLRFHPSSPPAMIFTGLVSGLAAVLSFTTLVSGYANPKSCSGACWSHDPTVIQRSSDGEYFRFETGSEIGIWKASSLSGSWVYQGKVLPSGSSIDLSGNTDCWAPDVHLIGSTYYLYYAVSTYGSQDSSIGLATSTTLEAGSWTDHEAIGVASSTGDYYNAIDREYFPFP